MKKMTFVLVLTLLFLFGCNNSEANLEKTLANNKARTVLTYAIVGNYYLSNGKCLDINTDEETYCILPYGEPNALSSIRIYFNKYYSYSPDAAEDRCFLIAIFENGTIADVSISCENTEYYIFGQNASLVRIPNAYCAYYLDDETKQSPYGFDTICEGSLVEEAIAKAKDFEEMIVSSGLTMEGVVPYLQKFHDDNAEKVMKSIRNTSTIMEEAGINVYFQFSNNDVYYDKYLIAHDINGNVVSDDIAANIARYLKTDQAVLVLDTKTTFVLNNKERFVVNYTADPTDTTEEAVLSNNTRYILKYYNDEYEEIINFDNFIYFEKPNRVYITMKSGCYLSLEGELPNGYEACANGVDSTSAMALYEQFNNWLKQLGLEKEDIVNHTVSFWHYHAYPALLKHS